MGWQSIVGLEGHGSFILLRYIKFVSSNLTFDFRVFLKSGFREIFGVRDQCVGVK